MPHVAIGSAKTDIALRPAPIEPSWIIEGEPKATNAEVFRSSDGTASTIVWECTEGKFNWYYDFDETVHMLEGSVVISSDTMEAKRFGPGDVVFFPKGSHARWHVEGRIRKLAFCRRVQPKAVTDALRMAGRLKRMLLMRPAAASLMDQPAG